jgi:hypothetical protein
MSLIPLYEHILKFAGVTANEEGYASIDLYDQLEPWLINGKRVVLPTQNHLRQPEPELKIIFHPLVENIMRGESEIIEKLRKQINIRLNSAIGIVAQTLINVIASAEFHSSLKPEQTELLIAVKDADETTLKNFINALINGMKKYPDRLFVNIYLNKGGKVHEKRYFRAGIVTWPFYKDLKSEKQEIISTKLRIKDKKAFIELFEFMFPLIQEPEQYNYGSNSNTAPYLEALMKSAANIASRINMLVELFSTYIEDPNAITFESDWLTDFENLDALLPEIRKIPLQAGNEGSLPIEPAHNQIPQPIAPPLQAPAFSYPTPQYPPTQQIQTQPPELRKTSRGIDFDSLKQSLPYLQMMPNPLHNQLMQQSAIFPPYGYQNMNYPNPQQQYNNYSHPQQQYNQQNYNQSLQPPFNAQWNNLSI